MGLEKQILNKDEPIASLFDIKLYRKDIQNLIPKNISKEEIEKDNAIFGDFSILIDLLYDETIIIFDVYSKPPYKYNYSL